MIGPVEGVEGFYCAVGMGGYSFVLAPAVGEMVARLVTDEASDGSVRPKRSDRARSEEPRLFLPPQPLRRATGRQRKCPLLATGEECPASIHELLTQQTQQ